LFSLRLATLGILIVGSIAFIINSLMSFIFHP
jgi:preprotein translocase subunit Sss1